MDNNITYNTDNTIVNSDESTTITTENVCEEEIPQLLLENINIIDDVNVNNDDNIEKDDDNIEDYDTLVLSGGSSKGIATLGALQYTYDNFLLKKVDKFIGTSSGAIISYLLSIGYTPIEIIVYICSNQLLEKLQHFNIVAMINGVGALSFNPIYEQLEKMTIDKIGYIPTFQDLKTKFNKTLICVTYNFTEKKTEYISYETYPNMPCLIALKMTSNLPLIFEKYKYGNNYYIDGGVSDNFAIDIGDKLGKKVLGILLSSEVENFNHPDSNILEYIYELMFIPISQTIDHKIKNVSEKCKIVILNYAQIKFFNFSINSKDKLELFSSGYQQMVSEFEK